VLDLGAAPGSWSRYAAERVGASGRVVAVDLQEIPIDLGRNVSVVRADVLARADDPPSEASTDAGDDPVSGNAPYDVVLSDMAPSTSGSKSSDQVRSFELFMKAVNVAARLGRVRSSFVGKIFMSEDYGVAKRAVERLYETCRAIKPQGTRSVSSELYLVGFGMRRAP
jgi:23S rRNA (uridine2552-2'-O)-methyltransferase